MKPTLVQPPDPICTSTDRIDALSPEGVAPTSILDERPRARRNVDRLFRGVRFLFYGLLDSSAFREVSLGREVSVIFSPHAPLVYRCGADNEADGSASAIDSHKVSPKRRIASIIRIGGRFRRYFTVSGLFEPFMKIKSRAAEPRLSATKPVTSVCGPGSAIEWRVSGKAMTIDEFIENQAEQVNSSDLRVLENFTGRLVDKLKETNPDEYPGMHEAVYAIVRSLEASASLQLKDPLPRWLAEIGFAASYLLKRIDLVPDHLPEIGLADDALLVQRVLKRNQSELAAVWSKVSTLTASSSH